MAGIYIVSSLITAIIFILTRKAKLTITKTELLVIRLDLIFISLVLTERGKNKKKRNKKKASSPEFRKRLFKRIKSLLSYSELEVERLDPKLFLPLAEPSKIPLLYLNHTLSFTFIALLSAYAKELKLSPYALSHNPESNVIYTFIIRAPLITLLYSIFLIRLDKIRTMRKKKFYVGHENG